MSLSLILGTKDFEKYTKGHKYIAGNDDLFNTTVDESWLQEPFNIEAMQTIDNIDRIQGLAVHNRITGDTHSPRELSTSCKTVILINKYPDIIFRARFANNCTPFIERIASKKDIILHSRFIHKYDFIYIPELTILNYGNKVVHSLEELGLAYTPFENYERNRTE